MADVPVDKMLYDIPFAGWSQDGVPYHQELELSIPRTYSVSWLDNYYRPALVKELQRLFSQHTAQWMEQNRAEFQQLIQLSANELCQSLSKPQ